MTLRQGLKPHGFFRHSSVGDVLRSGAWLRLGAHRNGGGIAETAHPFMRTVSCAVPCALVFPCLAERDEWPTTSACGVLGSTNTCSFCYPLGKPRSARLFLCYFKRSLHFLKPYIQWCRAFAASQIAWYAPNTGVFLPLALRQRTRTLFSFQGATALFYHKEEKNGNARAKATRNPPHRCHSNGVACDGFRSVNL